jgi:hypothetical protein
LISDVYAYIDPGSASAIIALLVGAIAGLGMTLKLYWWKLKKKLSRSDSI